MAGRSIWGTVFKNFIDSLKPRSIRGELVGKDHLGNTYYQINNGVQRKQRWFDPPEKDNFEQELPAEWESWLRYRRKVPPTEEEVLANAQLALQKKQNATELDAERWKKLGVAPPEPPGSHSFPQYKEYEIIPGVKENEKK